MHCLQLFEKLSALILLDWILVIVMFLVPLTLAELDFF